MIAMLCLRQGQSGGQSAIVSSVAVVNEVHRRRLDLVPLLSAPWPFAMTADATDHFELPLVDALEPFSLFYIRWYIEQSQTQADAPRLTPDHIALLDLVDAAASELRLDIDFEPGDVQLLSNRTVMHARTTFVDWDEPARRRHLLRLWLAHHAGALTASLLGRVAAEAMSRRAGDAPVATAAKVVRWFGLRRAEEVPA